MNASKQQTSYDNKQAGEHLIGVHINADPSNRKAIDIAARLYHVSGKEFFAIYCEQSHESPAVQEALRQNCLYALGKGAHLETLHGDDMVYLLGEFCRTNHIDLLVVNRPLDRHGIALIRPGFVQQLANIIPETQLLSVPAHMTIQLEQFTFERSDARTIKKNILTILLVLGLCSALCCGLFLGFHVNEFMLVQIFILAVLICSVNVTNWIWGLIATLVAVFLFTFFFAEPRFSVLCDLNRLSPSIIFAFILSLFGTFIGNKLHIQSQRALRSSWGTQVLLDTTLLLQKTKDSATLVQTLGNKLAEVSASDVVFYPYVDEIVLDPIYFDGNPNQPSDHDLILKELLVAKAALKQSEPTGYHTQTSPDSCYKYYPWKDGQDVYGIFGIRLDNWPANPLEMMIIETMLIESAQTMESLIQAKELENARVKQESDLLRSNLLKAIAHDIRTPLTSIIGNISNFKLSYEELSMPEKESIWNSIQADSLNMYYMVENLLTAARFDSSSVPIKPQPELLNDVIEAGLNYPTTANLTHPMNVDLTDDLLMVNIDQSLISQVVSNLVLNAIHHTPDGTPITIRSYAKDNRAVVEVLDEGQGISEQSKPRLFDIFYTGDTSTFDSSHFLGLGLFLSKAIIDAHHGTIEVHDNKPHGAIFTFSLPLMTLNR